MAPPARLAALILLYSDVQLHIGDLFGGGVVRSRALVTQQKTGRPVQFEVT